MEKIIKELSYTVTPEKWKSVQEEAALKSVDLYGTSGTASVFTGIGHVVFGYCYENGVLRIAINSKPTLLPMSSIVAQLNEKFIETVVKTT